MDTIFLDLPDAAEKFEDYKKRIENLSMLYIYIYVLYACSYWMVEWKFENYRMIRNDFFLIRLHGILLN